MNFTGDSIKFEFPLDALADKIVERIGAANRPKLKRRLFKTYLLNLALINQMKPLKVSLRVVALLNL